MNQLEIKKIQEELGYPIYEELTKTIKEQLDIKEKEFESIPESYFQDDPYSNSDYIKIWMDYDIYTKMYEDFSKKLGIVNKEDFIWYIQFFPLSF